MRNFFTLVLCTLSLCTLQATTYFASPDGIGDGSSYFSPTTFAAGVSKLSKPGDTLYLKEGTYEFSDKFSINKQGTSSKRIVIAGYPGERVVLDFHKVPYGTRGITVHANTLYLHIKDLAIAYSGKNNLYNEGSYCLFENLDIYGSADTGCQMKKGGNNIILNVDSHDNFDYQPTNNSPERVTIISVAGRGITPTTDGISSSASVPATLSSRIVSATRTAQRTTT